MKIQQYVTEIDKIYKTNKATEHSYRGALETYLTSLFDGVTVTNEPKRQECGAPDYILEKKKIPVGYIEAKDIGVNLDKVEKGEQLSRYRESLDNLIFTDYLDFRFFVNGEKVDEIKIAEMVGDKIIPISEDFDHFEKLLNNFVAFQGQNIKSSKQLAKMMAKKAKLMKDVFYKAVKNKEEDHSLHDQFKAFKNVLVHDMDEEQFADVYAQTIAYGLFTARLHDKTLESFSREEALLLIPKSNPFLRQLFSYVAGADLDERVVWIVNELCEVFRASDIKKILKDFGSSTGQKDPMLHFYETFLAEYDAKLRKSRGVWYTPEPVVNFIVRAVDDVLKTHFNLKDGIADKSKIKIKLDTQKFDKRTKTGLAQEEHEVHKVQLLDVATGTGTFLAEAVKQIYKRYEGQEGIWSSYVESDLLPRIHGFELLMASYAMCHMKIDLLLRETGYKPSKNAPRLSVYLTNALEEHHPDMNTLFASWLSKEANEASRIKRDMPIMVAFGNPPYSGESTNKGDWIMNLMEDYKKEPEGKIKLQERNPKWLNDDYAKFIRMGEHYIEQNGEGVLAYITSHSYLDNPTFRGMRWHLLKTFDEIYVIDLHGNAKKKETHPNGSPDINVFDIQQGVAIIIAVKKSSSTKLARLHHLDIWGKRQDKYSMLENGSLKNLPWQQITPQKNSYFFVPIDYKLMNEYSTGFSLNETFPINSVGIVTARDKLTIQDTTAKLKRVINDFASLPVEDARERYALGKDARDWKVELAQKELNETNVNPDNIQEISYRPFDNRWTYFTGKSKGFHCMPRGDVMQHLIRSNLSLVVGRQGQVVGSMPWNLSFITKEVIDFNVFYRGGGLVFPLYLYEETMGQVKKRPNLASEIYAKMKKVVPDITPESLFDYIYAVLHSPIYRNRYAEFLKSDFPHIPYPSDPKIFHALTKHGTKLRELHLMESNALNNLITTYPIDGEHEVIKPRYEDGNVWINETQYFGNVPNVTWNFYIGGYQPAQKWLKDRKGRSLSVDDIMHYQRIIVALTETDKTMADIDQIDFLPKSDKA